MRDELLATLPKWAIAEGERRLSGNSKATNKAYDQLHSTLKILIEKEWDNSILDFLNDENVWVQLWASAHCLELNEKLSVRKLEELIEKDASIAGMSAEYTLEGWKNGGLRVRDALG